MNIYNLIKSNPHALIAGTTGAGKSQLIKNLLIDILKDSETVLIDLKRIELKEFKSCGRVIYYACEPADAVFILDWCCELMDKRYKQLEQNELSFLPCYIVIDELADLIACCGGKAIAPLSRLARLARAADIHLILATQSPARRNLPAQIIQNVPCRVALRCNDPIESRQVVGVAGAERLPLYGSALIRAPQFTGVFRLDGLNACDPNAVKKVLKDISIIDNAP